MQTGQFFSPGFAGRDPSNTNTFDGLPDRIRNGNLPPGQRTIDRWFDVAAFAAPVPGRFGNSGVNVLEGPGLHVHHLSVAKIFRLSERFRLEYLTAISNLFNYPNFYFPDGEITSPSAGSISAVYNELGLEKGANRRIELRLRLEF